MARKVCTVDECEKFVQGHGLCPAHYQRWRRNGHATEGGRKWVADHDDGDRTCNTCDTKKPPSAFSVNRRDVRGISTRCRECRAAETAMRYRADLDASRAAKARNETKRRVAMFGGDYDSTVTREALRARYGDACQYCDLPMDFRAYRRGRKPRNLASVDHILPLSKGGGHTWANVALCCLSCNVEKSDRLLAEVGYTPSLKGTAQ